MEFKEVEIIINYNHPNGTMEDKIKFEFEFESTMARYIKESITTPNLHYITDNRKFDKIISNHLKKIGLNGDEFRVRGNVKIVDDIEKNFKYIYQDIVDVNLDENSYQIINRSLNIDQILN